MGFIDDDSMVRVDFFKESGKWYTTESIKFKGYDDDNIRECFRESLRDAVGSRLLGMWAVCLEPHHKPSHPLMIKWEG